MNQNASRVKIPKGKVILGEKNIKLGNLKGNLGEDRRGAKVLGQKWFQKTSHFFLKRFAK